MDMLVFYSWFDLLLNYPIIYHNNNWFISLNLLICWLMPMMPAITRIELAEVYAKTEDLNKFTNPDANNSVPRISSHEIPDAAILDQKLNLLDYNVVREHFIRQGRLSTNQLIKLVRDATSILSKEPNLLRIDCKCLVFGDFHGQFYDLVAVLQNIEFTGETLLFLGDYIDRGHFSVEIYLYLLLLKSHFPNNIFLLRGNHESKRMTSYFTFRNECLSKYNYDIYKLMVDSFKSLPLTAIIQDEAFCSHGGISPSIQNYIQINKFDRFIEPTYSGSICDILWSDPHQKYDLIDELWIKNTKRNCSYFYSYKAVVNFLKTNELKIIIRGHEVQMDGYKLYKEYNELPSLITIFSAPNYCDIYKNTGAYIEYNHGISKIIQYDAVNHPFTLPGFSDGLVWSLPFVSKKMLDLIIDIIDIAADLPTVPISQPDQHLFPGGVITPSTPQVQELSNSLTSLRIEQEQAAEISTESSSTEQRLGVVSQDVDGFKEALVLDKENELKKEKFKLDEGTIRLSPSETETIKDDIRNDEEKKRTFLSFFKFW